VLPLGLIGQGNSPYQSGSAFAGNPLFIDLEDLLAQGLIPAQVLADSRLDLERVDYPHLLADRERLFQRVAERFFKPQDAGLHRDFEEFRARERSWIEDFGLYMALKEVHDGAPWSDWGAELRNRDPGALRSAGERLRARVRDHILRQFLFYRGWDKMRREAQQQGITLIGDLPIFVGHDSADVWAHPELFMLGADGQPTVVAGVPPDYFSPTGQRWGHPHYRWDRMQADGFSWWSDRLRSTLRLVDLLRLDHFRGFEAAWAIPADAPTAEDGHWMPGPGEEFFETIRRQLGRLPLIAEDLGVITPAVEALRDQFELPGMRVLQFAFDGTLDNPFLPHLYPARCVAYTGTHDNNTSRGWFESLTEPERSECLNVLETDPTQVVWDMLRSIWASKAGLAVAPLQDFLELGADARMNHPGLSEGNWAWRAPARAFSPELAERIVALNMRFKRGRQHANCGHQ
jgi:4-alpha-glucanotransferase